MTKLLARNLQTGVYPEFSPSVSDQHKRLIPPKSLELLLYADPAPVIVLKPLIETQRIVAYLKHFGDSSALWMYRNPKDVTISYLKKFGPNNGINDLRPLLSAEHDHWICETMSAQTRSIALSHVSDAMTAQDATALGWWIRNRLFFDLELNQHPRVTMCSYENLVTSPMFSLVRLRSSLGLAAPQRWATWGVRTDSIGQGRDVVLSQPINRLCFDLWEELKFADAQCHSVGEHWLEAGIPSESGLAE